MAIWNRITAFVTGGAVATAAADAIKPEFEPLQQTAWRNAPYKVLDPRTVAALRARESVGGVPGIDRGQIDLEDDAARGGVGTARRNIMVELEREYPGFGELARLRRRYIGTNGSEGIDAPAFRSALRRQGMPAAYITALEDLLSERLPPGDVAAAIHRGLIPDPGLLQGEQPSGPRNVTSYPVYPIDPLAEAEASGYDRDRLGVLVGLQGLPMGVIEAAQAYYRGIITHGDYIAAFNESNNRNEWAEAVLEYAQQIPTARDFFENALRGYHDLEWAQKQAERHGMTPEDSLVIYQNQGRPMNIRQITQALSRGGVFHPEPGELTDPYEASVVEGNIKPAYYELAKALKYTLPSPFVMRQLTASGVWSEAKAAQRLKDSGWIPEDADEAAHAWATGGTSTEDPWVKRAETQFWNTVHTSYRDGLSTQDEARNDLAQLGITGDAANRVIDLWTFEQDTWRKQLTPAQIKKAWSHAENNPATGAPWTRDEAIERLLALGYNSNDAETFLGQ